MTRKINERKHNEWENAVADALDLTRYLISPDHYLHQLPFPCCTRLRFRADPAVLHDILVVGHHLVPSPGRPLRRSLRAAVAVIRIRGLHRGQGLNPQRLLGFLLRLVPLSNHPLPEVVHVVQKLEVEAHGLGGEHLLAPGRGHQSAEAGHGLVVDLVLDVEMETNLRED